MRQSDVAFDAMSIGSKSVRSHSGERTLERTQDTFGSRVFEADNNTSANRAWLTTRRDVTGRFRTAGGPAAQLGSCAPAMILGERQLQESGCIGSDADSLYICFVVNHVLPCRNAA